ncbi:MAG: hypothetical protein AAFR39_05235 [Pseudomonadota bacterium]
MSKLDAYLDKATFVRAVQELRENAPPELQIPAEQLPDVSDHTVQSGNAAMDHLFNEVIFEAAMDPEVGAEYERSEIDAKRALGDTLLKANANMSLFTSIDGVTVRTVEEKTNTLKILNELSEYLDAPKEDINEVLSIEMSYLNIPLTEEGKERLLYSAQEIKEGIALHDLIDLKTEAFKKYIVENPQPDLVVATINRDIDNDIGLSQIATSEERRGMAFNSNMGNTVASTVADDDASIDTTESLGRFVAEDEVSTNNQGSHRTLEDTLGALSISSQAASQVQGMEGQAQEAGNDAATTTNQTHELSAELDSREHGGLNSR